MKTSMTCARFKDAALDLMMTYETMGYPLLKALRMAIQMLLEIAGTAYDIGLSPIKTKKP